MSWLDLRLQVHLESARIEGAHGALYGDHIGCQPVADPFGFGAPVHFLPGVLQLPLQFAIDLFRRPLIAVAALGPLKVGYRHATGVGQYVRHDGHAALHQGGTGLGRERHVCPLDD